MRVWILIALAAILAIPCYATTVEKVTVQGLEQMIASCKATHQSDATVAKQLFAMELTERLSSAQFERMKAGLPGVKSRTALLALTDSSTFLDPPAAESLAKPAPDSDALFKMLVPVANYVSTTLQQLPNFLATREIISFEGQPPHIASRSTSIVTYRDHKEVVEKADGSGKINQTQGLVTHGVFGPILGTVFKDALTGSIRWGRWEAGANGAVAVILYAVPVEKSHYSVWTTCQATVCISNAADADDLRASRGQTMIGSGTENLNPAAYHGEIAFDPVSGAILRIAIVADMPPPSVSVVGDNIFVEYGAVEIGGKSYICPVRSISLLIERAAIHASGVEMPQRLLNDVVYRQYHRFGSVSRMLPPDTTEPAGNP